ncbi:MAG: hypothetical protein AAFV77_02120 [Planctomycetota bacterium]
MSNRNSRCDQLSEHARQALLASADRTCGLVPDPEDPTTALRGRVIEVQLEHPGGGHVSGTAILQDIDQRSIGMVYPGMLHQGTQLQMSLPRHGGGRYEIAAAVSSCHWVDQQMHAIVARSLHLIDLARLLPPGALRLAEGEEEPEDVLRGRCLLVARDELEANAVAYFLDETGMALETADSGGALLDAAAAAGTDAAILDLDTLGPGADQVIGRLVELGLRGGLVLLLGADQPLSDMAASEQTRIEYIYRPLTQDALLQALHTIMEGVQDADDTEAVSSLAGERAAALLDAYTTKLQGWLDDIERYRDTGERDRLTHILELLGDNGTTFGFPALTKAARTALAAMREGVGAAELRLCTSLMGRIVLKHEQAKRGGDSGEAMERRTSA